MFEYCGLVGTIVMIQELRERRGGERERREGGLVGTTVHVHDYQGGFTIQTYLTVIPNWLGGWLDGASS